MNAPHESNWMDGLSPSGRPAPEPPAAFLMAVQLRRMRRRMVQASTAAAVVIVGVLVAVLMPRPGAISERPIAVHAPSALPPATQVRDGTPARESTVLSLATFYTSGTPLDLDDLPAARVADTRPERAIRGGDRWDPDQVKSWLAN